MSPGPDPDRARAAYARHAGSYDDRATLRVIGALQRAALERLGLRAGARVLDVACGTGGAFAAIEERIGADGELIGVDLTRAMLDRARERVREHGWTNVRRVQRTRSDLTFTPSTNQIRRPSG